MKYQNLWNNPPSPGDLVEVGYDCHSEKPFIGVVTELAKTQATNAKSKAYGCVLVNGQPKWCDIYDLKPVKGKRKK